MQRFGLGLMSFAVLAWAMAGVPAFAADDWGGPSYYPGGQTPASPRDPTYVPGTPQRTSTATRPASWPGGSVTAESSLPDSARAQPEYPRWNQPIAAGEAIVSDDYGEQPAWRPPQSRSLPNYRDGNPQDRGASAPDLWRNPRSRGTTPQPAAYQPTAYAPSQPAAEPDLRSMPLPDDTQQYQRTSYSTVSRNDRLPDAAPEYRPDLPPQYVEDRRQEWNERPRDPVPAAEPAVRQIEPPPRRADSPSVSRPGTSAAANHAERKSPVRDPRRDAVRSAPARRGDVLARVGSDVILSSDLGVDKMRSRAIEKIRAENGGQVPMPMLEELETQIKTYIREPLQERIDIKLLAQSAAKSIPAENLPKVKESIGKEFDKRQVPRMMAKTKVQSQRELEEKLAESGLSLDQQKRDYIEQALAMEWLRQQAKVNEEVNREEMLNYYREHAAEFEHVARARWEQLTVRVAKYPSRDEAYSALARMGNDVLRGVPFAEVAKARSHGPSAAQGGIRDWTTQGSLVSKLLDRAIFGLPIGGLSQIIEEDDELHIVRVAERQEAYRTSFEDSQAAIKEKFRKQREKQAREDYLARLRKEIPVWTVFDDKPAPQQTTRIMQNR